MQWRSGVEALWRCGMAGGQVRSITYEHSREECTAVLQLDRSTHSSIDALLRVHLEHGKTACDQLKAEL